MSQASETTRRARVLLVDDHDLFRTGLRNLLEEQGGVQVRRRGARTGAEAVRLVRELAPDVVVMDLNMPSMSGVEATRHITALSPLTRVIVLTISDEDGDVLDAIVAGACGYLLKDSSISEVVAGIHSAAVGPVADLADDRVEGAPARAGDDRGHRHGGDDPRPSSPTASSRC